MAKLWDDSQGYNAIGRSVGRTSNTGSNDNFITKKIKSAENAIGTTAASIVSPINNEIHTAEMQNMLQEMRDRRQSVANKYGYADIDALYTALDEAEANGDTETANRLLQAEQEDRALTSDSANKIKKSANEFNDYLENSWVSKKIDQDRGKFAGSAMNTLSTAFDIMSLGAGIPNGAGVNALQGAWEGVADELEQNGGMSSENVADWFGPNGVNWKQAGQNAAVGAASGLATGALNTKLGNRMATNGGNIINGKNFVTKGANSALKSGVGRGALSGAVGGAVGGATGSAISGQDIGTGIQNTLTGAAEGAKQGAVVGGTMSVANKAFNKLAPNTAQAMQENAARNASYGDTMREQFKGAWNSGDSRIANNWNDFVADYDNGFGPRYNRFAGDGEGAINYLLNRQGGEVEGAVKSPAVEAATGDGNIDLVYGKTGDDGYGLAHIVEKHGVDIAKKVPSILENGKVLNDPNYTNANRITLISDDNTGAVRLGWDGNKKQWVVTAYEGLPYSPASSATDKLISSTALRGSSVQGPNDATVNSIISQDSKNVNGGTPETEVYRTVMGETETPEATNSDLMYGESELGNRTRRGMLADSLERFGNTLEGAQTNVTRAAAKDLGIESTGKVVENVRKKTGLTNLETQAALAKELTGGENSLMDNVQRIALTASETGQPYKVDTDSVARDVESIVDKYTDTNMFGSQNARTKFISNLRRDITNYDSDLLSIANRMKANAADLRGKGVASPTPLDSAKAKIYTEVANRLDDLSYKAIPQENVDAMFDATISEMRGRATQAANNGNNDIAKAYNLMADKLDAEPRTIKAFRSFKKDFVDIAKINELTARAENGAAVQMGRSFGDSFKRFGNSLLQRPINTVLAKAGGAVNSIADKIGDGGTVATTTPTASVPETPTTTTTTTEYNPSTRLYNIIGRNVGRDEGEQLASEYIQKAAQEAGPVVISNSASSPSTAIYNAMSGTTSGNGSTIATMTTGDYYTDLIGRAMMAAAQNNDVAAFGPLFEMYQSALQNSKTTDTKTVSDLSSTQQAQLAKLDSAEAAIDELEGLFEKAGGGKGPIAGNLQSIAGTWGWDPDANTYNQLAEGLVNQIAQAVGKTDSLNTEGEVKRALQLIPQLTDDATTAKNKLEELRRMLANTKASYNTAYGVAS